MSTVPRLQVVWLKRDLRLVDHAPLTLACQRGPVLLVAVYEPSLWSLPECSGRHAEQFAGLLESLVEPSASQGLVLRSASLDMLPLLDRLRETFGAFDLHSHEETTGREGYARDLAVQRWCRAHGLDWRDAPSGAVVRRLDSRDRWSSHWLTRMEPQPLGVPTAQHLWTPLLQRGLNALEQSGVLMGTDQSRPWRRHAEADPWPQGQPAGRAEGLTLLRSFLEGRGRDYRRHMSSPGTAESSCSRLSTHLAWGSLSVREVVHAVQAARADWRAAEGHPDQRLMLQSLKSFESRLHWHCHFIQKLESDCRLDRRCLHSATRGLRNEGDLSPEEQMRLEAWKAGRTGFPFVDACMRYLLATGWINFRMRAMLVSFASQLLWLHWRAPGLHLARAFSDYEPGIHWPQMQMQSGTTGINTIRIYNPDKQAADQDPTGAFVARWVPEAFTRDYPPPIVNRAEASKHARDLLWSLRKTDQARKEAAQIFEQHGSRHPQREGPKRANGRLQPRQAKKEDPAQGVLF